MDIFKTSYAIWISTKLNINKQESQEYYFFQYPTYKTGPKSVSYFFINTMYIFFRYNA